MVNWNSRMIRRKGQAVKVTLQVESVMNNDGERVVTFSIPNLPAGFTAEPVVIRFTPDADEDAMADAVQPDDDDDDDNGKKGKKPGKSNRPHGTGG